MIFYPDKIKKDNLSSYCKSCCLERDSSPEVKEYKKKYWKREEVLENKRKNYLKPETQKKRKEYLQRPEVIKRISEYNKTKKCKDKSKEYRLMRKYNVTTEEYKKMVLTQENKCAICGNYETSKNKFGQLRELSIDHCHKTGKVRKLLCSNCNSALGMFNDNIEILRNAIDYLKKYE